MNSVLTNGAFPPQVSEVAQMLRAYAKLEGLNDSPVDGVCVYRTDSLMPRTPVIYDPCLVIVVQGCKRGYLDDHVFEYNSSSYLACCVPVPFDVEILEASPEQPFLARGIPIIASEIGDLQMQIDDSDLPDEDLPYAVDTSPLQGEMLDAVARLVRTFDSASNANVLGPLIRREILYRVLTSEQGGAMRAVVQRKSHFRRIGDVMRTIHDDCAQPVTTADMMRIAGMSKTTLHKSFKAVTAMTPLQFVKSVRLHQAKALMLNEGLSASTAAYQVGYASASQFSREFKRLFGLPPSEVGKIG